MAYMYVRLFIFSGQQSTEWQNNRIAFKAEWSELNWTRADELTLHFYKAIYHFFQAFSDSLRSICRSQQADTLGKITQK